MTADVMGRVREALEAVAEGDPWIGVPINTEAESYLGYRLQETVFAVRAALSLIDAMGGEDGWLPIADLPKDGLYILATPAGEDHHADSDGWFYETWSARSYHEAIGPDPTPAQRTLRREAEQVVFYRKLPAPPALKDAGK